MASASTQFILGLCAAAIMLLTTYRLRNRISIGEDFAIARRRLSAWPAALSQGINCVPLWLLTAIAFHAYSVGLAAVWMAFACFIGQVINWWLIAPRVRDFAATPGYYALTQLLTSNGERLQAFTSRSAFLILLFTLGLASVTLLQWSAQQWIDIVGGSYAIAVIFLASLALLVVAFGGLWSASAIDSAIACIAMLLLALIAALALWQVGGSGALWAGLRAHEHVLVTWFSGYAGILAMAFFVGVSFIAFTGSAQPQVFSRYLACKDETTFKKARLLALAWTFYVLAGALLIGWCGRVLLDSTTTSGGILQKEIALLFGVSIAPAMSALLLIALSVASLSLWLGIATHFATDLRAPNPADATGAGPGLSLSACRWGLFFCAVLVVLGAIYLPVAPNEDRLWFCLQASSAAFAPLLFVRLSGKKVRAGSSLGAIWSGFILSGLFHLMPDTPGDLLERSLPFVAAMGIALSGGERRRNPDRADRGDKTVHDHLPI